MIATNHCLPLVLVSSFHLPHLLVIFLISLSLVHYHHLHHLINVFIIASLSSWHCCLLTSSSCHLCRPHLVLFALLISLSSRYCSSSHYHRLCWHPVPVIIAFIWSSFHHDSHVIVFSLSLFHHFIFHISSLSFPSHHPWFIIIVFIIFLMSSSSCPHPLDIAVFFCHHPVIYVCLVSSSSPSHHHPIFSIGLLPSSSSSLHHLPHFIMITANCCLPLVVVS